MAKPKKKPLHATSVGRPKGATIVNRGKTPKSGTVRVFRQNVGGEGASGVMQYVGRTTKPKKKAAK